MTNERPGTAVWASHIDVSDATIMTEWRENEIFLAYIYISSD